MKDNVLKRAIKKTKNGVCTYKVTAMCFDEHKQYIGMCTNTKGQYTKENLGYPAKHAEQLAIKKFHSRLKTIVLLRTNKKGDFLPIECCPVCKSLCEKFNIEVLSIGQTKTSRLGKFISIER